LEVERGGSHWLFTLFLLLEFLVNFLVRGLLLASLGSREGHILELALYLSSFSGLSDHALLVQGFKAGLLEGLLLLAHHLNLLFLVLVSVLLSGSGGFIHRGGLGSWSLGERWLFGLCFLGLVSGIYFGFGGLFLGLGGYGGGVQVADDVVEIEALVADSEGVLLCLAHFSKFKFKLD
jgi:hypothetical protein